HLGIPVTAMSDRLLRSARPLAAALVLGLAWAAAPAQTLRWNPNNNGGATAGSGLWSVTSGAPVWFNGTAAVPWADGNAAVFGGTGTPPFIVTIDNGGVTASA